MSGGAELVLATYRDSEGDSFHIEEVNAAQGRSAWDMNVCVTGIHDVLLASWQSKFVPDSLSDTDVRGKIPDTEEQAMRIAQPTRQARYLIACAGELPMSDPEDVQAIIRVERYRQRRAFGSMYPNITDLETRDGQLHTSSPYHRQAAALLLQGLAPYRASDAVSAYTERPDDDGLRFYGDYGFVEDNTMAADALTEVIGNERLTYVHMRAATVAVVRDRLIEMDELTT